MFKIGAFAVILDRRGKVLLCHRRDYDLWNLPGGGVESGENPWDAVIREVKEETGLNVTIERLQGIYNKPKENDIVFNFICRVNRGAITLNDEAGKIEYFDINNLPKNTVPKQIERIKDAVSGNDKVIMKEQFGAGAIELVKQGKL